ncbi:MAG: cytochrome c family protein [Stappiaceae bacterium]
MDSFEFNKIAGAILMSLLIVMGLGILSDEIFRSDTPDDMGYQINVAEAATGDGGGGGDPSVEPIGVRLASADALAGEKVAKKCAACHTFDDGGANKVGPNLWEIVNRKPGVHAGFKYSGDMVAFGGDHLWDYDNLDKFLEKPKDVVAKTSMGFAGLRKPKERADMIAYLRSLAATPVELPDPAEGAHAVEEETDPAAEKAAEEATDGAAEETADEKPDAAAEEATEEKTDAQ